MKLKTLKDIPCRCPGTFEAHKPIELFKKDIRKEAIKWINRLKTDEMLNCKICNREAINFIRVFFNLTEEDLKRGRN
jgi:hypothetical protein